MKKKRILVDMSVTLLHHGHIRILKQAANYGDVIVGLTSDKDLKKYKGYLPELNYCHRKEILESIKYVKEVVKVNFHTNKKDLQKNKIAMGLVANKLLLAFKNKPGFLEELVMKSTPSLMNILQNIKKIMIDKGYVNVEQLQKNKEEYVNQMKSHSNVKVTDNIIVQYGGGKMTSPGSYDRYTPFKNNPEADFIVIAWPLGLVQASCNPFKKERELKGVNLGEIAQEVLSKWEGQLKQKEIPLSTIKWISESSKDFGEMSVGFTFKDFAALYGNKYKSLNNGKEELTKIGEIMIKPFSVLSEEEKEILDNITINAWDLIQANSGGHKCITNISGLNFMGRNTRPPKGKYKYNPDSDDSPYIKFVKMIQNEFVKVLQNKIKNE